MKTPQKQKSGKKRVAAEPQAGELLFEIGTEELPYQFVPPAIINLREAAERLFKEHRLTHDVVRAFGTPRRLVLVVESLASRQTPITKEVMGPSKTVAFDGSGVATKAALGFAGSQGIKAEELEVRQTPKGEYVFAVKRDPGRAASQVLTELLSALIASLSFPKSMRWNDAGIKFPRPIRWILALYGGQVVDLTFGRLTAGNRTWGHRFIGSTAMSNKQGISVKDFKSYANVMGNHGVVPDQEKRRTMIRAQLNELSQSAHGMIQRDEGLLDQAVYTVEYPHAILGTFDQHCLSVPKEVLMTSMKEHQGFFSLTDKDGALLPAFISVTNMKLSDMRLIREGNERVLAARLADAKFFFDEDRKITLADRAVRLGQVTFHQKLGTLSQKQERVKKLVDQLAARVSPDNETFKNTCLRAAALCKADLLTGMVGEFPTLQGIMGGEYARHDGESEEVSRAIREHHLPQSLDGELPNTLAGKILSLADRLDTLAAFFHVGIVPTGSEDPLALRRQASAIVRIIVEGDLRLNLGKAVDNAKNFVGDDGFKAAASENDKRQPIVDFIFERLRHYGRTLHGLRSDVMDALLKPVSEGPWDLVDLLSRMKALQFMTTRPEFDPLMIGFKRAHRIVEKEQWSRDVIDSSLFQHPAEADLYKLLCDAKETVPAAIARGDYAAALNALVRMKPAIDGFFNGVLVNAEDEKLRTNRLSLLFAVDHLFLSFADFSQIVVQGG